MLGTWFFDRISNSRSAGLIEDPVGKLMGRGRQTDNTSTYFQFVDSFVGLTIYLRRHFLELIVKPHLEELNQLYFRRTKGKRSITLKHARSTDLIRGKLIIRWGQGQLSTTYKKNKSEENGYGKRLLSIENCKFAL